MVDPKEVAHLSGLEFFEALAAGKYPPPPICQVLNFGLVEVEHGRAVFDRRSLVAVCYAFL
ncbi:MAG TPA: hypothetical protein VFH67_00260 [bacterium]|nr:hypothetical protein [bacterium]